MPRHPRFDEPGAWFHLGNRGVAKRTMFDTPEEIRYFLALLAREVRAGRLLVIAFCIMSTHFHLLVVSLRGQLSGSMQRVQNQYVRRFNRRRRRDGPLVRGRYFSRRVRTDRYRRCVVGYIDRNPVTAKIVTSPDA
jgi:REP element-mobilizing transposase RayT